jgi:hypothetical protein
VTRFDASTAEARRELFVEALAAHRERGSQFLTVEADPIPELDRPEDAAAGEGSAGADPGAPADSPSEDESDEGDGEATPPAVPPWLQYADGTVNLDCTDAELDALKRLIDEYPELRVDRLESPETAAGTNVRVTAYADDDRLAAFFDRTFRDVYGRPADYRAWVVAV